MRPLTDALRKPRITRVGGFPRDIRCLDGPPGVGAGPVDGRACVLIDACLPPGLTVQKRGLLVVETVVLGHGNAEKLVENSGKFAERIVLPGCTSEVGERFVGDPEVIKIAFG